MSGAKLKRNFRLFVDSLFVGEGKNISANESSIGFEEMEDTITKVALKCGEGTVVK